MQNIFYITIFCLGLVLASFLNALMYRIDKEYKYPEIFIKPSHCEKCKKQLQWYDLIPVLSYIFTKGKCSKCGKKINIYYPISELFLGISMFLLYYTSSPWYTYVILVILFSLTYFDLVYKAIPQTPTLLFLLSGLIYTVINSFLNHELVSNALLSGLLLILGITLLLILMYGFKNFKEGFGFGDFLVLLTLSMFLTTQQFWLLFWISIFIALIVSILGFITKKYNRKTALPLLPFFTLGYIVVVTYSEPILKYLSSILIIL
ncbi:MAG: prepilin peptidase [Candidatus Dojkabacteria bacterium]|nr:prepilin peptidase [Candidatus Dojkabacteria bacterium]